MRKRILDLLLCTSPIIITTTMIVIMYITTN